MTKNRYWNSKGLAQAKYDEMESAGYEYAQRTYDPFHTYYRYYNDGDLPGWARSRWDITRHTYRYGYIQRVLTEEGEKELERRVTQRIEIDYRRFLRTATKSNPARR